MIYKLQRPLASNVPSLPLLAYTEGRRNMMELPASAELLRLFDKGEAKVYVEAEVVDTCLSITRKVEPQDW